MRIHWKHIIQKKYLLYGSSIVFTRGLEMLVLFYAAHKFSKNDYGQLEFYKKVIEVAAIFFAFGFPSLLLSYTRNRNNKVYLYYFSIFFVFVLSLASIPFLYAFHWLFLLIPFVFYALFFTGGITQSYFLVLRGSHWASYYKIVISFLFYTTLFYLIYKYNIAAFAYVYTSYILFFPLLLWLIFEYRKQRFNFRIFKKYATLFRKLILSSFTLVLSTFTNMMFLYTDIFIFKIFSQHANVQIANYSFSLNIANIMLLIPLTLVQVDIEKLKQNRNQVRVLFKRIFVLLVLAGMMLLVLYKLLINTSYFYKYNDTYLLFVIILGAKFIQSLSPLFGTYMVIKKKFKENLFINIFVLLLNIVLSYALFITKGVYGVAVASAFSLGVRYLLLLIMYKKIVKS